MSARDIDDIREEYNERIAICLESGVDPKIAKEIALKESKIEWSKINGSSGIDKED